MSTAEWHCPACGGYGGEAGFFVDHTYGGRGPLYWGSGVPEKSVWNGMKQPQALWNVQAVRCTSCGHLELSATHPVTE